MTNTAENTIISNSIWFIIAPEKDCNQHSDESTRIFLLIVMNTNVGLYQMASINSEYSCKILTNKEQNKIIFKCCSKYGRNR